MGAKGILNLLVIFVSLWPGSKPVGNLLPEVGHSMLNAFLAKTASYSGFISFFIENGKGEGGPQGKFSAIVLASLLLLFHSTYFR